METGQLVASIFLLIVAIVVNALALQGAVRGRFRMSLGRQQNLSVISYQQCLISLLSSNVYVCAANAVLVTILACVSLLNPSQAYLLENNVGTVIQRVALVGFIANLLNYCVISFCHFAQVINPHNSSNSINIFGKKSAVNIVISIIWAFSFIAGFLDYPIVALEALGHIGSNTASTTAFVETTPHPSRRNDSSKLTAPRSNNRTWTRSSLKASTSLPAIKLSSNTRTTSTTTMTTTTSPTTSTQISEENNNKWFLADKILTGSPVYKTWIECGTILLALVIMFFLIVLCAVVVRKTSKINTKIRLRRSMITAILLLACFIFCWMPLVCYDMLFVLPVIFGGNDEDEYSPLFNASVSYMPIIPSARLDAILHPICFTMFMMSPIIPPFIFIFRNHRVQRFLVDRYGFMLPSCLVNRLLLSPMPSHQLSTASMRSVQRASSERPLLLYRNSTIHRIASSNNKQTSADFVEKISIEAS